MKKLLLLALSLALLLSVFTVAAMAEDEGFDVCYYVDSENGNDDFDGLTPYRAVKTFSEACRYAAKHDDNDNVAIVFINAYKLSSVTKGIEHENHFTVTTNDGITDYGAMGAKLVMGKSARFNLPGPTTFENITFDYTSSITFVGNYFPQKFGKNVQFNKLTEEGKGIYVYGGYRQPLDTVTPIDRDAHLTFESGDYYLVVAGSRALGTLEDGKKSGHILFQNTNYLDIRGGNFQIVYGGTHEAHAALNVDITVSGGTIGTLSASGDVTRRAYGDAIVRLYGGEIGEFKLNNIVRKGDVIFGGAKVEKASVLYASTQIEEYAAKANQKKTVTYDANYYTADEIAMLTEGYDTVINATYVYAKAGANGSGASEKDDASFADAFALAAKKNAVVKIIGAITVTDFTEPAHDGRVIIRGADEKAVLTLNGTYTLAGETEFTGITVDGDAKINAKAGMLCVADATIASKPDILGSATISAGTFGTVSEVDTLIVDGATVEEVFLSGNADATVSITAGTIEKLAFSGMQGEIALGYLGGTIASSSVEGNNKEGTLSLGGGKTADMLGAAAAIFTKQAERVVFTMDGATGSGVSPSSPASFADAYAALAEGGTLVIMGEVRASASFYQAPEHSGKVTITSLWDGVDYRESNDAKFVLPRSFYLGGDTDMDHVTLISEGNNAALFCFFHDVTFGRDIIGGYAGASTTYPCIVTGAKGNIENVGGTVTVNGGDWQRLRLGNSGDNPTNVRTDVVVNGGNFHGYVYMLSTSHKTHSGKGSLTVNGGNFYSGILGAYYNSASTVFDGDLTLTINGGTVYNVIHATNNGNGVLSGSFTLILQGGDFSHLTDITGIEKDGFKCKLQVSEAIDVDAKLTGTYAYQNDLRQGPDPFLFYHDGCYYYTCTSGAQVRLYKAANFGDFRHGISTVIYDPANDAVWGKNLWAPEIHHFTAEEVGEKYAGWYLYVGGSNTEDTTNAGGQRLYVLKALSDDLQGQWGHPETGEVNVPMQLSFPGTNYNTTQTTADASVMRIGGKPYLLFFTTYRAAESATGKPYQAIVIANIENPWTFPNASEICHPEYDWEKVGEGTMQVVEGAFGLVAPDGTTYIVYSGSGYWTTAYCLASLRFLGGDPLAKTSWEKAPEPFLTKSDSVNGCGHASAFTSPDGKMWVCYHGYIGKDATGSRYSFVEPIIADKNGIKVGNGSGNPAPLDTVWTVNVNPQPIREKISGFSVLETVKSTATVVKLTIGAKEGFVNGASKPLDAAPVIRNARTMLPVRFVAENLGATVGWDGTTSTVTVETPAKRIEIVIGKTTAKVNGVEITLDSPAFIENSRTYLPVRFVAENLGATVGWDGATSTATLTK